MSAFPRSISYNRGNVYLIQPAELLGTNRYKIGCSSTSGLTRVKNGYKVGTRYIQVNECNRPYEVEKELKTEFRKEFLLVCGSEWFEGNQTAMILKFNQIVMQHLPYPSLGVEDEMKCVSAIKSVQAAWKITFAQRKSRRIQAAIISQSMRRTKVAKRLAQQLRLDAKILLEFKKTRRRFPTDLLTFKEDIMFGGTRALITLDIEVFSDGAQITVYALDYTDDIYNVDSRGNVSVDEVLRADLRSDFDEAGQKYFHQLIDNKIIENGKVYDINNPEFTKKLDKYKKTKNNVVSDRIRPYIDLHNANKQSPYPYKKKMELVVRHLFSDTILNKGAPDELYCDTHGDRIYIDRVWGQIIGPTSLREETLGSFYMSIIKHKGKQYDKEFIRAYLPYCIRMTETGYYILNRNYEYITLNTKAHPDKENVIGEEYMYHDCTSPKNSQSVQEIAIKYKETTTQRNCKNMHANTTLLLGNGFH